MRHVPDSIVDLWREGGQDWLLFSGAATVDGRLAGGATFRMAVDPAVSRVSGGLQVLMRADCRDGRPDGGRACTKFDSDYAGAGTVFPCPSGPTVYFYHGENHTEPTGQRSALGNAGWTGIGQAVWDLARRVMVKQGQIAGLNASHVWRPGGRGMGTDQTPAASGNPSVVADPTRTFLYLYFADRSPDPETDGPDRKCSIRTCWAVARAPLRDVCARAGAGQTVAWRLLRHGAFTEPALLPDGTGGTFTPILDQVRGVDNLANVTAAPSLHGYLMASIRRLGPGRGTAVDARFSTDGLSWSASTTLMEGGRFLYPRIVAAGGRFVLLYVVLSDDGLELELRRETLRVS